MVHAEMGLSAVLLPSVCISFIMITSEVGLPSLMLIHHGNREFGGNPHIPLLHTCKRQLLRVFGSLTQQTYAHRHPLVFQLILFDSVEGWVIRRAEHGFLSKEQKCVL